MRELVRAIADLEEQLHSRFGISLNEAMVLCCLANEKLMATNISENTGLTPSNTSKVLRSAEDKKLVERSIGLVDRRQMSFALTEKGKQLLAELKTTDFAIPEFVKPLF